MAVSVRMNPLLEKELEQAARRQGVSKSQFIIDAVERALGHKTPYELLLKVKEEMAGYPFNDESQAHAATEGAVSIPAVAFEDQTLNTGADLALSLEARHQAELQDWLAWQAEKSHAQTATAAASLGA